LDISKISYQKGGLKGTRVGLNKEVKDWTDLRGGVNGRGEVLPSGFSQITKEIGIMFG